MIFPHLLSSHIPSFFPWLSWLSSYLIATFVVRLNKQWNMHWFQRKTYMTYPYFILSCRPFLYLSFYPLLKSGTTIEIRSWMKTKGHRRTWKVWNWPLRTLSSVSSIHLLFPVTARSLSVWDSTWTLTIIRCTIAALKSQDFLTVPLSLVASRQSSPKSGAVTWIKVVSWIRGWLK